MNEQISNRSFEGPLARFVDFLIRRRTLLAVVGTVILVVAFPFSRRLTMDRGIEQMFAATDPTLLAYHELQSAFGGNAVVMLVYRDEQLMTAEGLERAATVSQRIAAIDGVRGVLSVAQLNDLLSVIRPAGLLTGLSRDVPPLLRKNDNIAIAFERLFTGYTHGDDDQTSAVVAMLRRPDAQRSHRVIVDEMRELIPQLPEECVDAVLVGEPVLLDEGFDLVERDGERLAWWTIGLLSPVVLILLRQLRWIVLQSIVITWAVTVTRALLYGIGLQLSLVSSILTAIVTVITVTAVIHLGTSAAQLVKRGGTANPSFATDAGAKTLWWLLPPIFWACLTDAAGFASLLIASVAPVRDFGLMMAVASLAVLLGLVLMSPLFLCWPTHTTWLGDRFGHGLIRRSQHWIRRACGVLAIVLIRHRRMVGVLAVVLLAITGLGLGRLQIESSFLRNFRPGSPIVQAYEQVESQLNGAGVWDVLVDAPPDLTEEYLRQVRELENELRAIEVDGQSLTKVISMADADRIASAISLLRFAPPSARLAGMRSAVPAFSDALLVPAGEPNRKLRIMLRSREHLPAETKLQLIAAVETVVVQKTAGAAWQQLFEDSATPSKPGEVRPGRVTGYYVMIARLVAQLIRDQWKCFAFSVALVWVLLAISTRSLRVASYALLPNVLPVLTVIAAFGWSGAKLNMGAAMIAAVSIGLSIDGSVHFLANYGRKIARGRSARDAAIYAQRRIGVPILMATIALVVGFSVLASSDFVPTASFGILTAAALVLGTVANLTLLPALLGGGAARRP